MLGIIGAMDNEMNALFDQLTDRQEEQIGFSRFVRGNLAGIPCVLSKCGVGKVHAAACAQTMALRFAPEAVLNIGVAGALRDDLQIGDIVIGQCAVQHDVDTTPFGDPPGLISGINLVEIPCDEGLTGLIQQAVREAGLRGVTAAIATGDRFVAAPAEKRALARAFSAAACDMEGGAIAQVCYEMHVPYAAYRAISDTVEGAETEYTLNLRDAAAASARLLPVLLKHWRENHG